MKSLILFILTMSIMYIIDIVSIYTKTDSKTNKIYYLIFTLVIPFNTGITISSVFSNNTYSIGIHYVFMTIICIFISSVDLNYLKLTLVEILFIVIGISIVINYCINEIYDINKFISIVNIYISMNLLFIIFKNIAKENKYKILSAFSYVAIFNGILSILQYITGKKLLLSGLSVSILYTEGISVTKRAVGIAGTNNAAGNLSAILFSICIYNYIKNRRLRDLIAIILTLISSMLTLTRIGYLAIFVQVIIFFLMSNWHSINALLKKIKIIVTVFIPSICILLWKIDEIIRVLFLERGSTESYRFIQFDNVITYLSDTIKIFDGIGIGQYTSYLLYKFGLSEIDLHSQLINTLVDQGIFITVIFSIIHIIFFINAIKNADDISEKAFIYSLCIGNLICSNFNPNQFYYLNNIIFIILLYGMTHVKPFKRETYSRECFLSMG